jgi:hypothetical protein
VIGLAEHAAPAPVAGEHERAGRGPAAERLHPDLERLGEVAVGAPGVASVQSDDLPGAHVGAHGDRARLGIRARQPAHEKVALNVLGLVGVDDDAHEQPSGDHPLVLVRQPSIVSRSFWSAGLPASSEMTLPSAAVIVSSGPTGRRALGDARQTSTSSKRTPTAPADTDLVPVEERRAVLGRPGGSQAAQQGHHRHGVREEAKDGVRRKGERVGKQQHAGGALEIGHARERAAALDRLHRGVKGARRSFAERRRPDGHRCPVLDLRGCGRARPRRRSPRAGPARASRDDFQGGGRIAQVPAEANMTTRSQASPRSPSRAAAAASAAPARGLVSVERPVPIRTDIGG